jgi:hypothetical protein
VRSTPIKQSFSTPFAHSARLESTSSGRSQPRSWTSQLGPKAVNRRTNGIASGWRRVRSSGEYDHPAFALVLKLVDKGRAWVKLSGAYRDNQDGPPLMPMSAGSPGRT